jgi:hypothetical protein
LINPIGRRVVQLQLACAEVVAKMIDRARTDDWRDDAGQRREILEILVARRPTGGIRRNKENMKYALINILALAFGLGTF